jgi:hypothetical protein
MLNKNLYSKAESGGFLRKIPLLGVGIPRYFGVLPKAVLEKYNSFDTTEEETIFDCVCDDGGETLSCYYKETNGG